MLNAECVFIATGVYSSDVSASVGRPVKTRGVLLLLQCHYVKVPRVDTGRRFYRASMR